MFVLQMNEQHIPICPSLYSLPLCVLLQPNAATPIVFIVNILLSFSAYLRYTDIALWRSEKRRPTSIGMSNWMNCIRKTVASEQLWKAIRIYGILGHVCRTKDCICIFYARVCVSIVRGIKSTKSVCSDMC